jgi:hypothetical protein
LIDTIPIGDTNQDTYAFDGVYLHLVNASGTLFYEGNITSVTITKPADTSWGRFTSDVDNPMNCSFRILDAMNAPLSSWLDGSGNDISSIDSDTIRLFGSFDGAAQLNHWEVTITGDDWIVFGIDADGADGWSWEFPFPEGPGEYWFYSIGKKDGWTQESLPQNPSYDTFCLYNP